MNSTGMCVEQDTVTLRLRQRIKKESLSQKSAQQDNYVPK